MKIQSNGHVKRGRRRGRGGGGDTQIVGENSSVVRVTRVRATHCEVHDDVMRSGVELGEVGGHAGPR